MFHIRHLQKGENKKWDKVELRFFDTALLLVEIFKHLEFQINPVKTVWGGSFG